MDLHCKIWKHFFARLFKKDWYVESINTSATTFLHLLWEFFAIFWHKWALIPQFSQQFPSLLTRYSQKIVISSSSSDSFTRTLTYGRTEHLQAPIIFTFRLKTRKRFLLCLSCPGFFQMTLHERKRERENETQTRKFAVIWAAPVQNLFFISNFSISNLKITFFLTLFFLILILSVLTKMGLFSSLFCFLLLLHFKFSWLTLFEFWYLISRYYLIFYMTLTYEEHAYMCVWHWRYTEGLQQRVKSLFQPS